MSRRVEPRAIGSSPLRVDGRAKVTGTATYAYEHPFDSPAYAHLVQATIARGRVTAMDTGTADAVPGVLSTLTVFDAPSLSDTGDAELAVLQSDAVAFRGQVIGAVVAESPEAARHAASLVQVDYDVDDHETAVDTAHLYSPEHVDPEGETDTNIGEVSAALAVASVVIDQTYTTPMQTNNPMEPHTTVAVWDSTDARLTLFDSTQGVHVVRAAVAPLLGLEPEQVRVVAPYVGGGFGSKGTAHAHDAVAALCALRVPDRPVKLALTRQQTFTLGGHRTPTTQRVRLGADLDGRIVALAHDVSEHTSRVKQFAEETATISRMMYAAPNRRTSHRVAALDVPVNSWMRAPGEAPGSFGLEVAMDELAEACGLDPIALRVRNDPDVDPESGKPWSRRALVECLTRGADRFGWADARAAPGSRRDGDWLVGVGVAASTYPCLLMPGSAAEVERLRDGSYTVVSGQSTSEPVPGPRSPRSLPTPSPARSMPSPSRSVTPTCRRRPSLAAPPAPAPGAGRSWRRPRLPRGDGTDPPAGACTRAETPDNPDRRALRPVLLRRTVRGGTRQRRHRPRYACPACSASSRSAASSTHGPHAPSCSAG